MATYVCMYSKWLGKKKIIFFTRSTVHRYLRKGYLYFTIIKLVYTLFLDGKINYKSLIQLNKLFKCFVF